MRKLCVIALCLILLLPLCALGASAAEPTLIRTVNDYKAIANNLSGSYKLDADLTLNNSATLSGSFKGSFDGNGHVITLANDVTSGVFSTIDGAKVFNLTIEGQVKATGNAGALANEAKGTFELTNVINKANVSTTGSGKYVGGLIGQISAGSDAQGAGSPTHLIYAKINDCINHGTIHCGVGAPRIGGLVGNCAKYAFPTFTNCVNYGRIDATEDTGKTLSATTYLGGISSDLFAGKFENCLNKGEIYSPDISSHAGGICGRLIPSPQMDDQSAYFIRCTNEGNVTVNSGNAAGMVGNAGLKLAGDAYTCKKAVFYIDKCVNKGRIKSLKSGMLGAFVGYGYGSGTDEFISLTDSINYGIIGSSYINDGKGAWASQFIGYTNSYRTVIKNCVGLGKIENADSLRSVITGLSTNYIVEYQAKNNTLIEYDGTQYLAYSDDEENARNRIKLTDRPAGMVYVVNSTEALTAAEYLGEVGYAGPHASTAAPFDPSIHSPDTSDRGIYFAVAALVAVIGTCAVVLKKKIE